MPVPFSLIYRFGPPRNPPKTAPPPPPLLSSDMMGGQLLEQVRHGILEFVGVITHMVSLGFVFFGVIFYELYHDKSPSFTTIWENIFGALFPFASKQQIQVRAFFPLHFSISLLGSKGRVAVISFVFFLNYHPEILPSLKLT